MSKLPLVPEITAIAYPSGARIDDLLSDLVEVLRRSGLRLAGFVQRERERPERQRCDMLLEDLSTRKLLDITEDRGPHARGCRLDVAALISAMNEVREAVPASDLLIVNKFGKTEGEGGGFRPLIADAVEHGVPVLIAVPYRNLEAWRRFAGATTGEFDIASLDHDPVEACRQLGLVSRGGAQRSANTGGEARSASVCGGNEPVE